MAAVASSDPAPGNAKSEVKATGSFGRSFATRAKSASDRAAIATRAPCAASERAQCSPIPRLAPVTNANRPSSVPMGYLSTDLILAARLVVCSDRLVL